MRQTLLPVCGCRNRGFAIEPAPVLLRKNVSRAFDSASTCDSHGDRLSWRHGSQKGSTNGKFPLTYLTLGKILLRMGRKKNPHAQALGALGGKARAENLSDDQLAEIYYERENEYTLAKSGATLSSTTKRDRRTRCRSPRT